MTDISTICFPSTTLTLFAGASVTPDERTPVYRIAPPMNAPAITIEIAVDFIIIAGLEAEQWLHEPRDHEGVHQIIEPKEDNNKSHCFKENTGVRLIVDAEGAKAHCG